MLESRWLEGKKTEIPSTVRLRKKGIRLWGLVDRWSDSILGIATWSVETLLHRNDEMLKCENTFRCRLWSSLVVLWEGGASTKLSSFLVIVTWRVETLHHRNVEMPKYEMAKSMWDPVLVIQWCWILGNLIEGILFLFTVNRSVTIQSAKLNHDSWTVGDSFVDAFSWRFTV